MATLAYASACGVVVVEWRSTEVTAMLHLEFSMLNLEDSSQFPRPHCAAEIVSDPSLSSSSLSLSLAPSADFWVTAFRLFFHRA